MDISSNVTRSPEFLTRTVKAITYPGIFTHPRSRAQLQVNIVAFLEELEEDPAEGQNTLRRTERVMEICQKLSHPNIQAFFGTCKFSHPLYSTKTALVFQHCSNGCLSRYLKGPGCKASRIFLMVEIAKGISYLHSQNIVHGDITPANILIQDDGIPVLSDFGRSKVIGRQGQTTQAKGTCRYSAPEAWSIGTAELTTAADVYSFGMTGLLVFSDKLPYHTTRNDVAAQCEIQRGTAPQRRSYMEIKDEIWHHLEACWGSHVESRPPITDILTKLSSFL